MSFAQCGEKGQWEKALELLGEMRTGGLRPDQNSYRFAMKVVQAFRVVASAGAA